jgi:hypothetical protein
MDFVKRGVIFAVVCCWAMCFGVGGGEDVGHTAPNTRELLIGWGAADLTPPRRVIITGQMYARVSEGVQDPMAATVLALESRSGADGERVIMISCDLICIPDELRDAARDKIRESLPKLEPHKIILFATHTHAAPEIRPRRWDELGVDLDVMPSAEYVTFVAERIAAAAAQAWKERTPGAVSFGLGHAVVGRNRLVSRFNNRSVMYGKTDEPEFSHLEGYEDHSVNILATWNADMKLTGLIVNVVCPSQVSESQFQLSADYWHETRLELRRRLGEHLFVLAQCGTAGDQSPRPQCDKAAEERMWKLAGRTQREEIAVRIADAVTAIMPVLKTATESAPILAHRMEVVPLPRRMISDAEAKSAAAEAQKLKVKHEQLKAQLEANPELRKKPRWYLPVTEAYARGAWYGRVAARKELQEKEPKLDIEVHVLRLGDVVFATNPFEYYLDYGMQIKARSKAVQTFLVQLAGGGTYLPTARAVAGGAYGSVPSSTAVGPEGGRELARKTVELINGLWKGTK